MGVGDSEEPPLSLPTPSLMASADEEERRVTIFFWFSSVNFQLVRIYSFSGQAGAEGKRGSMQRAATARTADGKPG